METFLRTPLAGHTFSDASALPCNGNLNKDSISSKLKWHQQLHILLFLEPANEKRLQRNNVIKGHYTITELGKGPIFWGRIHKRSMYHSKPEQGNMPASSSWSAEERSLKSPKNLNYQLALRTHNQRGLSTLRAEKGRASGWGFQANGITDLLQKTSTLFELISHSNTLSITRYI